MADEYSGSGHFVGESSAEPSAPAPAKKASIQERKSKGAEAKDPNPQAVASNVNQTLEAMGPLNPPIGEVVSGVAGQAGDFIGDNLGAIAGTAAGAGGLFGAYKVLQDSKQNSYEKGYSGRPANATLGAPVPTLTEAVPSAPVPSAPTGNIPPATFPAQATQQPVMSGYKPATGNLIEGAPSPIMGAAPAPVDIAPAPVAPVDPLVQARIDAISAAERRKDAADARANDAYEREQRRKDEIHELNKAKQAQEKIQASQGKSASPTSADQQAEALLKKSAKNELANSVANASKQPPVTAPVTVAPPVTPATTPAPTPAVTTPPPEVIPTTAPAQTPEQIAAKTQATQKAVLGTEPAKSGKWPGGAEGSAAQLFGGTKKNFTPEELAALQRLIASTNERGDVQYPDYYNLMTKERKEKGTIPASLMPSILSMADPIGNLQTTLGRFTYSRDADGNLIVVDKYDFNKPSNLGGMYGLLRNYAGEKIPTGFGRDVRINLGKTPTNQPQSLQYQDPLGNTIR